MLLSITTTYQPATDLGFLLHKNPERVQSAEVSFGQVHVVYPEANAEWGVRAASLKGAGEIGRLSGDMSTGDELYAGQRLLLLEALADEPEHRHLAVRPLDALLALRGQIDVLDVVLYRSLFSCHKWVVVIVKLNGKNRSNGTHSSHFC